MSRPLLSLACAAVAACALLITPDALAQSGKAKSIDLNTAEGATLAGRRILMWIDRQHADDLLLPW